MVAKKEPWGKSSEGLGFIPKLIDFKLVTVDCIFVLSSAEFSLSVEMVSNWGSDAHNVMRLRLGCGPGSTMK